ncbi:MAG: hypothetical protein ACI8RD_007090 [Bacillariaceae sp.]|jgi:hypothetical protein
MVKIEISKTTGGMLLIIQFISYFFRNAISIRIDFGNITHELYSDRRPLTYFFRSAMKHQAKIQVFFPQL